jgi:hypothetical protein
MPLAAAEHGHKPIDAFLRGLLPDNDRVLDRWARRFQVSARSAFALIAPVGEDRAGAAQFASPERLDVLGGKVGARSSGSTRRMSPSGSGSYGSIMPPGAARAKSHAGRSMTGTPRDSDRVPIRSPARRCDEPPIRRDVDRRENLVEMVDAWENRALCRCRDDVGNGATVIQRQQ